MECGDPIVVLNPEQRAQAHEERVRAVPHKSVRLVATGATLIYTRAGRCRYRNSRSAGILEPDSLLVVPPGPAEFEIDGEHDLTVIAFREPAEVFGDAPEIPALLRRLDPDEARAWGERVDGYAARAADGRFDDDDLRRLGSDLHALTWRSTSPAAQATVGGVLDEMRRRAAEPLRLRDLARLAGYSTNHLNDLTRMATGRSLGAWLTEMRMVRARVALAQTELPIAEIGLRVGYEDPAYFARAFRRVHGVPPLAWRIAARPDDPRFGRIALPFDLFRDGMPEIASAVA